MGCNTSQDVHQPTSGASSHDTSDEPTKPSSPPSKYSSEDDGCDMVEGADAQKIWPSLIEDEAHSDDDVIVPRTSDSQLLNTSVTAGLGAHGASLSSHQSTVTFPLHQHRRSSLEMESAQISTTQAVIQVEARHPSDGSTGNQNAIDGKYGIHRASSFVSVLHKSTAGGRHRARSFASHSGPRLSIPTSTLPPPRYRSRSLSLSTAGHAVAEIQLTTSIESWGRAALIVDPIGSTTALITDALALGGYLCEVAQNCDEALDMARTRSYFMILLDASLSDDDALHISRLIRSFENSQRTGTKSSSLIFRIADSSCFLGDVSDLVSAGLDGCIRKSGTLSQEIHEALAMKAARINFFALVDKIASAEAVDVGLQHEVSLDNVCVEFADGEILDDTLAFPMAFERRSDIREMKLTRQVLLVQESQTPSRALCKSLSSCGYALHLAHGSEDAIKKAAENGYDVILVEMQESTLSRTITCCKELRSVHRSVDPHRLPFVLFGLGNVQSISAHASMAMSGINGCLMRGDSDHGIHEALALFRVNPSDYVSTNNHGHLELTTMRELECKNALSWRQSAP